jgi:hypothetical protein
VLKKELRVRPPATPPAAAPAEPTKAAASNAKETT